MPSSDSNFFWRYIKWFARVFGMITTVAAWGVGIAVVGDELGIGLYTIFVGLLLTILEFAFIFQKCACCSEGSNVLKAYELVVNLRGWIKCILYILLSIVCFLKTTWCILAGVFLCVDGLLYLASSFVQKKEPVAAADDKQKLPDNEPAPV